MSIKKFKASLCGIRFLVFMGPPTTWAVYIKKQQLFIVYCTLQSRERGNGANRLFLILAKFGELGEFQVHFCCFQFLPM